MSRADRKTTIATSSLFRLSFRLPRYSLMAMLVVTTTAAFVFTWLFYEREAALGEFLYWDLNDGLAEFRITEATCGIHSDSPGDFFLTFICDATPVDPTKHGDQPRIEISLLFDRDPSSQIIASAVFPVQLSNSKYGSLQTIRYSSVWENFENATITIHGSDSDYIDATLKGIDGAGSGSEVEMRARFKKIPNIARSFSAQPVKGVFDGVLAAS